MHYKNSINIYKPKSYKLNEINKLRYNYLSYISKTKHSCNFLDRSASLFLGLWTLTILNLFLNGFVRFLLLKFFVSFLELMNKVISLNQLHIKLIDGLNMLIFNWSFLGYLLTFSFLIDYLVSLLDTVLKLLLGLVWLRRYLGVF